MVKVQSYRNGEFTGTEQIYQNMNQAQALEAFRKEYPGHADCLLTANYCNNDSIEPEDITGTCVKCGNPIGYKRTDLLNEPILCDSCYGLKLNDTDCEKCTHSYFTDGDRLVCEKEMCTPNYIV